MTLPCGGSGLSGGMEEFVMERLLAVAVSDLGKGYTCRP